MRILTSLLLLIAIFIVSPAFAEEEANSFIKDIKILNVSLNTSLGEITERLKDQGYTVSNISPALYIFKKDDIHIVTVGMDRQEFKASDKNAMSSNPLNIEYKGYTKNHANRSVPCKEPRRIYDLMCANKDKKDCRETSYGENNVAKIFAMPTRPNLLMQGQYLLNTSAPPVIKVSSGVKLGEMNSLSCYVQVIRQKPYKVFNGKF